MRNLSPPLPACPRLPPPLPSPPPPSPPTLPTPPAMESDLSGSPPRLPHDRRAPPPSLPPAPALAFAADADADTALSHLVPAEDHADGSCPPLLARRDTLVPPAPPRLWMHAPSPASTTSLRDAVGTSATAGATAPLTRSARPAAPLSAECDPIVAATPLDTPRPQQLRSLHRPLDHTRTPSRSPSPLRSRSTSPPPSASSVFASAPSMSTSWRDEETSADDTHRDDVRQPELARRPISYDAPETPKATFAILPHEILLQIFRCVQAAGPADLTECLTVNRRWCCVALELMWYKHTFYSPRVFDRMISVLARSTRRGPTGSLEKALVAIRLSDHAHKEHDPIDQPGTTIKSGCAAAAHADAMPTSPEDSLAVSAHGTGSGDVAGGHVTLLSPHSPVFGMRAHSPIASADDPTMRHLGTTPSSPAAPEAVMHPPVAAFPYCNYVRRINCCLIGKDLIGPRAEAFSILGQCSQLERLTLAGAKNIPVEILRNVLSRCTAMVAIDLTDVAQLNDETLEAVAKACPRLQGINLTNCTNITSDGVVPLALHCPLLRRVKLGNCPLVTNSAVIALARNCRHLLEMDLTGCAEVSDEGVAAIWRHTHVLRELKLTGCAQLTALGFPAHNAGLVRRTNILPNGIFLDNEWEDNLVPRAGDDGEAKIMLLDEDDATHEQDVFLTADSCTASSSAPSPSQITVPNAQWRHFATPVDARYIPLPELGRLPPRPPRIFEQLRNLDLGSCTQLTDPAIEGVINHAPRLRNLVLSKCSLLTDEALYAISRLGKNLHYLHLGRCEKYVHS